MTYEELQKANKTIKKVDIKGKMYAEVVERVRVFRMLFPNGTISTELVSLENGLCVFKATAMNEDGQILATGHAYEKEGSSFINKTSYIENAESSAVGRCLGMLGIGIDISIASYEEVANAIEQQSAPADKPEGPATQEQQEKFINYLKENNIDPIEICNRFGITKQSTRRELNEVLRRIKVVQMQEGK